MKTKDGKEYNKKRIGRFILLFIVLVMVLSNGAIRDKVSNLLFKEGKTLEITKEMSLETLKEYQLAVIDNKIITYSQEGVWVYNFNGERQPIKEIDFSNAIITHDKANIYITNGDNGEIQVFKNDGAIIWTNKLEKKIDNVFTKNSNLALTSTTTEGYQEISMIDSQGKLIGVVVVKNGQVILVDGSNNFEELLIATIDVSEQQLVSSLVKYSREGNLIWVETFIDEIIQDVKYLEDKSCILVTDKKIYHLNKQKEVLWSRENRENIWDLEIDNESKSIILLYKSYLEIMDFNGRIKNKISLNEEFERVEHQEGTFYLHNDKSVLGITGNNKFMKYSNDGKIDDMVTTSENIILAIEGKIRIMDTVRKN